MTQTPTRTEATERSLAEELALAPPEVLEEFLDALTPLEAEALQFDWEFHGRPKQQWPDGDWTTWAIIAGRGFGKTQTGAHATRKVAEAADVPAIHLIAPTPADYRDVMIEGPAGILQSSPKWTRPEWFPSKRLLEWPNGVKALCFSAEDPEALRGPQCGFLWGDEPGAWTKGQETWDMAQFGLRIPPRTKTGPLQGQPRQIFTTTPKPFKWIKAILADETTHITRGTTYENLSNLAPAFKRTILKKYEGTTLGRQELLAELIESVEGALWSQELIASTKRYRFDGDYSRVCVAVDPAVTSTADSDETGISVCARGDDGHLYVLEDATPGRVSSNVWAQTAIGLYYRYNADVIVAEVNNGGDMVLETIRNLDRYVRIEKVTATRGKQKRAAPISALFEQKQAHLLGDFPLLEQQMTQWVPPEPGESDKQDSPDRLDAMVWALFWLTNGAKTSRLIV